MGTYERGGRVKLSACVQPAIRDFVERIAATERRSRSSVVEVLLGEALEARGNGPEYAQGARTAHGSSDDTGAAVRELSAAQGVAHLR